ncbi:MAG: hypothetical protein IH808_01085 [Proteobacteria bacterium]|nr:hypothetical protein [Pseudomonadota bacterium]
MRSRAIMRDSKFTINVAETIDKDWCEKKIKRYARNIETLNLCKKFQNIQKAVEEQKSADDERKDSQKV